jgi:hypothetical protein
VGSDAEPAHIALVDRLCGLTPALRGPALTAALAAEREGNKIIMQYILRVLV